MNRQFVIKTLDKISPIMSGVGAFVGALRVVIPNHFMPYSWVREAGYPALYIYFGVMPALLAYLSCTCTHRKLWFYSPGAVGGSVGALIGMSVGGILVLFIGGYGCLIFTPILAMLFSYLFHKHYVRG